MGVYISLLRGINLAGHHSVSMKGLRALYVAQGLQNPRTYIQSGNVVFETIENERATLTTSLNKAIEAQYGFRADVVLRTSKEMEGLVTSNPLVARKVPPAQNLVVFLSASLTANAAAAVCRLCVAPEEVHTDRHHLFCFYPNGQGRSKLGAMLDKELRKLDVVGTARNWNTVLKLIAMAQSSRHR